MLEHDIFYNRKQTGYEELTSYLPLYWKNILEMDANNRFAGYTLDRLAGDMEQLMLDQFIETCSKKMLVRFEHFLKIYDTAGQSIDERKAYAKAKWIGSAKMSGTRIQAIIKAYCGCECTVALTDKELVISMVFDGNPLEYMPNVRKLLSNSTIPIHIYILYEGDAKIDFSVELNEKCINSEIELLFEKKDKEQCAATILENEMNLNNLESFSTADIVIENNLHYLDGSKKLDGSRLLNSYIKKEEL